MQRSAFSCLLSLLCLLPFQGPAQDMDYRPNLIPPSPDASSLGKYAEHPVGLYTGTLPTVVPLYTVIEGPLQVPIHVSYHAGGNKVEEAASLVGLGFSLHAGGAVMRSVRNLPDDQPDVGFLDYSASYSQNYLNTHAGRFVQWEQIAKGCADAEPDAYFFNFGGYTGSFTFDWQGEIRMNADIAWKTSALRQNPLYPDRITGWEFIHADGTIYILDTQEEATIVNNGFPCQAGLTYNSAWYLSQIRTPNEGRRILFNYESYTQHFTTYSAVTHRIFRYANTPAACQYTPAEPTTHFMQMHYACRRIKTITNLDDSYTVTFNYLNTRSDEPGSNVKQLDEVIIKNREGTAIRKFSFTYDYGTGRLTLKSIKKAFTDEPPYEFDYNGKVLPPRTGNNPGAASYGQDHWGYFNGKTDNANLLSGVWKPNPNSPLLPQLYYKGGDRNPDKNQMDAGMLTQITYPAGGRDQFSYQAHEYGAIGAQTVSSLGEYVTAAGGLADKREDVATQADAGPSTVTRSITIKEEEAYVDLELNGLKAISAGSSYVEIYKNGESQALYRKDFSWPSAITTDYLVLKKGDYLLKAFASKKFTYQSVEYTEKASLTLRWKEQTYTAVVLKKKTAGGPRISSITSYAYPGDLSPTVKQYLYDDGTSANVYETSSGVLNETPFYEVNNLKYYAAGEAACSYDLRITQNKALLGYGPHIGYARVTERLGANGSNGKTVYKFLTEKQYPALPFKQPPFQQSTFNPFAPGNSTGQQIFKLENELDLPVNEAVVTNWVIENPVSVNGLKFRFEGGTNTAAKFTKGVYESRSGEWYPVTVIEKEYASDGINYQQKKKTFHYENKRLKTEKLDRYRDAAAYEAVSYFYADDFVSPTPAIQEMVTRNMIGLPLEIIKEIPNGLTTGVTGGVFNTYTLDGSGRLFPGSVKKLQTGAVIPVAAYQRAVDHSGGAIDPHYATETTFEKYDSNENLVQLTEKNGVTSSFVYNKHDAGPVLAAAGAQWDKVAWSGFENTDPVSYGGIWTLNGAFVSSDFASGKRCYTGHVTVNTGGFPAISYTLSFLMKGSSPFIVNGGSVPVTASWTFYSTTITGGSTVSINTQGGWVDEVRIYPAGAQLSTTSYDQLIGASCITDVKSKATFYEYDELWRLHLVKDHNKDIVKRTGYEFEILSPLAYTLNVTQTGNYTYQFQIVGGSAGYTYEWDFDDLSTPTSTTSTTLTRTFPSLTLEYQVKVKVKNSVNTLATLVKPVKVIKTGGSTASCNEIQGIALTRSSTNPKQVSFAAPVISGATYWWDFGDNTSAGAASSSHVFPAAGDPVVYNVTLTVSAAGKSCSTATTVKINP